MRLESFLSSAAVCKEERESRIMGLCIWREARGEPPAGRLAVADVILERVRDKRWNDSIEDVILQPFHFSSFNEDEPQSRLFPDEEHPSWKACVMIAETAMAIGPSGWANHFLNPKTLSRLPSWYNAQAVVGTIQNHVFLKL